MEIYNRINTLRVKFDITATRPSALEVHDFVADTLHLTADQVDTLQLIARDRAVYIKLISVVLMERLLEKYAGSAVFTYANGERTPVTVEKATGNTTTVRVFDLPPEIPNEVLRQHLERYGTVYEVRKEQWGTAYKIPVNTGVRAAKMALKTSIPNTIMVVGYRLTVSYAGQVKTCYVCGQSSHVKEQCPNRKSILPISQNLRRGSTASSSNPVVQGREPQPEEKIAEPMVSPVPVSQTGSPAPNVSTLTATTAPLDVGETTSRTEDGVVVAEKRKLDAEPTTQNTSIAAVAKATRKSKKTKKSRSPGEWHDLVTQEENSVMSSDDDLTRKGSGVADMEVVSEDLLGMALQTEKPVLEPPSSHRLQRQMATSSRDPRLKPSDDSTGASVEH